MAGQHICPREEICSGQHERLDGEPCLAHLERSVFREQTLLGATIDADDSPIGLLTGKPAREVSPWRFGCNGLEKGIG